jgi:hypothetical protein
MFSVIKLNQFSIRYKKSKQFPINMSDIDLEQLAFTGRGTFFDKHGRELEAKVLGAGICIYENYKYQTHQVIPKNANAFALGDKDSQYKQEFPIVYLRKTD